MCARSDIARSFGRNSEFVARWHEGVLCGFGPYPPTRDVEGGPADVSDLDADHEGPVELFDGLPKRVTHAFRGGTQEMARVGR